MTLIVSLSGGLASAANALLAHESGEHFLMIFADTTVEDDDLHRFIYDIEKMNLAPLLRVKDGRDPWGVFADVGYIGNTRTAPCSRILKTDLIQKTVDAIAAPDDPLVIGFSFDEDERAKRAATRWFPRPVRSLIAEKFMGAGAVEDLVCSKYGIKKPRIYDEGFIHNNCGGFCVRGGQGQFARLLDKRPAVFAKHEQRNETIRRTLSLKIAQRIKDGTYRGKFKDGKVGGFIRVTRDGETEYLHMREFRERIEAGTLIPANYEMSGCGCFTDDE